MVAAAARRVENLRGHPLALHKMQIEFISSPAIFRGFVGGRGAGKSFIGSIDLLLKAKADRLYLVSAPTYGMLKDATYRTFMSEAERLGRLKHAKHSSNDMWCEIHTFDPSKNKSMGTAEVIFRSSSDPEKFRGPNLSGGWLDEASVMHEDAFKILIACLREGGESGSLVMTFTPKGRQHWTYNVFFDNRGNTRKHTFLAHASSRDNPFLPEEYVDLISSQYTSKMQAQEIGGSFIDAEGTMFRGEWFGKRIIPEVPVEGKRVRYWDKAGSQDKGCYTVGTLMVMTPERRFYVEDVVRGQWTALERNGIMYNTAVMDAGKYKNRVQIWVEQEGGSGGLESAQISLRELSGFPVYPDHPTGDKAVRATPFAAQCEAGNVYIKDAPWNQAWLDEIIMFPESTFKDQVDSAAGAFNKLALGQIQSSSSDNFLCFPYSPDKMQKLKSRMESHDAKADKDDPVQNLISYLNRSRRR